MTAGIVKTKNLTPFPFGTKVTSRRQRRCEMTLILRACYVLVTGAPLSLPKGTKLSAQGAMSADTYREEDAERAGECLYPGDFADWKPHGEVMLRGTCHTPSGKPLTECPVRFSVGRWSKTLRVIGKRLWSDDSPSAAMTKPAPFTKMPVDYAHAYGGPGYAANPVGLGVAERELPSIEHPSPIIESRRDDPGPAGFGPLNPAWPLRAGKVGTKYDARWKAERFPFYAEDFDWTHFNAAPVDQQLEGYLRGDEKLLFQNLHPTEPVFETALPAIRIRAFVKDVEKRFREATMHLDTLFVDLDEGKLYLTWRGLDPIKTDDMTDVLWGLVASEKLGDAPLPEAHYRERLEAFEADPLEVKTRLPAGMQGKLEEMQARQKARDEGRPVSQHDAPAPDPVTANLRTLLDQLPVALPNAKALEASLAGSVAAAIAKAPPQVDLKAEIAKAANDVATALAKRRVPAMPLRAGGPPPAWAAKSLQKTLDQIEAAKQKIADTEKIPDKARAELAKLDEEADAIKKEPFFRTILERPPYQDPGPGKNLYAQDYADRDLRGEDLHGANLKDANLAGANLARANLAGAILDGAVLAGADLTEANLAGADLTLANLTSVRAKKADFRKATLHRAFFQKADLAGAVFREAKGDFVFFPDADLTGADCQGMSLFRSLGKGATLARADFTGASLVRCLLVEVSAPGVKLSRALLTRTSFAKGDLTGADLTDARGDRSVWLHATLHDANFARAILPRAQLRDASALRASFRQATLKNWRCYRTSFERADFTESQLFEVEFSKCAFARARFNGACLYGAKFRQATGGGCDFSNANLTRAVLEDA